MDKKDDGKRIIFHRLFGGADGFRYANIRYLAAYERARRALRCECAPVSARLVSVNKVRLLTENQSRE